LLYKLRYDIPSLVIPIDLAYEGKMPIPIRCFYVTRFCNRD